MEIAEEMAARDALRRIFRTDEARPMLPMGDQASNDYLYTVQWISGVRPLTEFSDYGLMMHILFVKV